MSTLRPRFAGGEGLASIWRKILAMQLTAVVFGYLVLGQASSAGAWVPVGEPSGAQAVAVPQQRPQAPQLVAEALNLPPRSAVAGRPISLLTAVSAAGDPRQHLEIVRSYWRLVEAVCIYHFCMDYDGRLGQLQAQADESALLRTAQASSAALVREAELAAVAAQYDLAALMRLPAEAPLPLPADRPHVGPYRTHFSELFAARSAPPTARLLDRTLPLRREAVEGRAAAVQAAEEGLAATAEARRAGRCTLTDVLGCLRDGLQQRQALLAAVCRYNGDIADYVVLSVGPVANAQALVAMLIEPARGGGRSAVPPFDSGVRPASHSEPVPTPARRPGENAPTPAVRRSEAPSLQNQPPTPSAKEGAGGGAKQFEKTPDVLPKQPVVPVETSPPEPAPTTVNRHDTAGSLPPVTLLPPAAVSLPEKDSDQSGAAPLTPPMYAALLHAAPEAQAKQLALALHWDRMLPPGIGEPIGLDECLRGRTGAERRAVIDAFWLLRQRAAEYQVLAEEGQWLEEIALKMSSDVGQSAESRLRPTRLANQAALQEARTALIEAQFDLALRIGRAASPAWPLASTVPRAARYSLKLDIQPRQGADSWPMRRLAALIPGLADAVQRQATAVVEADAARAAATTRYQAGGQAIEPVLAAISRQSGQTMSLLRTLTDYNRAVAAYVLTTLPPDTPSDKLVGEMTKSE